MTSLSLTITASPSATDHHQRAQRFLSAALAEHVQVTQIFFYQEAVQVAGSPGPLHAEWTKLASQAGCPLYVCVSAAERRGLEEVQTPWEIVGLGDWLEGMNADRSVHFGD